jgi:tetratricopeptide (TPR) repeat protein
MKWLRTIVAVCVIAASGSAALRLVIPRFRCNNDKAIAYEATTRLREELAGYERTSKARGVAEICRRCLQLFPEDYEFLNLLALNEEALGDHERAEKTFQRSIALNARPETYGYLGMVQLERGRVDDARKNLYYGALFNLSVVEMVSEPLRSEVAKEVLDRHQRLNSKVLADADKWRKKRRRKAN